LSSGAAKVFFSDDTRLIVTAIFVSYSCLFSLSFTFFYEPLLSQFKRIFLVIDVSMKAFKTLCYLMFRFSRPCHALRDCTCMSSTSLYLYIFNVRRCLLFGDEKCCITETVSCFHFKEDHKVQATRYPRSQRKLTNTEGSKTLNGCRDDRFQIKKVYKQPDFLRLSRYVLNCQPSFAIRQILCRSC
jgi:hypothetical protein